jgi:hypothetical protein
MDFASEARLVQLAVQTMRVGGVPVTPKAVEQVITDVERKQAAVEAEIRAGLADTGCVAALDTDTGGVRVYATPVGPGATVDPPRRDASGPGAGRTVAPTGVEGAVGAALSPTRRSQLEQQLPALRLIVDDNMSSAGARRAAAAEVADLEKLLALPDRAEGA